MILHCLLIRGTSVACMQSFDGKLAWYHPMGSCMGSFDEVDGDHSKVGVGWVVGRKLGIT